MKKIISFLLAAAMLILSIPFAASASADAGSSAAYTVTVSEKGTNVLVTVDLENNIAGDVIQGNFTVTYNAELLTCTSVDGKMGTVQNTNLGTGQLGITYSGSIESGTVVVLTFTKGGTGESSDYGINIQQKLLMGIIPIDWFFDAKGSIGITPDIKFGSDDSSSGSITAPGDTYNVIWNYGGKVKADGNDQYTITPSKGYAIDEIWVDGEVYDGDYQNMTTDYLYHGKAPTHSLVVFFAYTLDF